MESPTQQVEATKVTLKTPSNYYSGYAKHVLVVTRDERELSHVKEAFFGYQTIQYTFTETLMDMKQV